MSIQINNLYIKLKDILNKEEYFIIKNQRGGRAQGAEGAEPNYFFKNELNNFTHRYNIIQYMILYQIIEQNIYSKNPISKELIDQLDIRITEDNINDIVDNIHILTVKLILNNIFENNYLYESADSLVPLNISYSEFIIKNDLIFENTEFEILYDNSKPIYLIDNLSQILSRDKSEYYKLNINDELLMSKFKEILISDLNINILAFNKDIYYLYLCINSGKKIILNEDKFVFDVLDILKYYNYILFSAINSKYVNFTDEKKQETDIFVNTLLQKELNEININNVNFIYDEIFDYISKIYTNLDFPLFNSSLINIPYLNNFKQIISNIENVELVLSNVFHKYIYKNSESVQDNSNFEQMNIEQVEIQNRYYEWYIGVNENERGASAAIDGFHRLNINNFNMAEILDFFQNIIRIPELYELTPLQFKLIILLFKQNSIQIEYLIHILRLKIYILLNDLHDPFFYVIEDLYKHYYSQKDIDFLRNYVQNLVYINQDYKYIYTYFKTHGARNYISKVSDIKMSESDYVVINNVNVYSFLANEYYKAILQPLEQNKYITPNIKEFIYNNIISYNYDNLTFKGTLIDSIYYNIFILYYKIIGTSYIISDTKQFNTNINNYILPLKLNNYILPLKLNKYNTLFDYIKFDDEIISYINNIINIDTLHIDNDIFNNKKQYLESLIQEEIELIDIAQNKIDDNINQKESLVNEIAALQEKIKEYENNLTISEIEYKNLEEKLKMEAIEAAAVEDGINIFEYKQSILNKEIEAIKTDNNYDLHMSELEIIEKDYEKAKYIYDSEFEKYNEILQLLKDKFIELKQDGVPIPSNINFDESTPLTDINSHLLIDLYTLATKNGANIDSLENIDEDKIINESLVIMEESPYIILADIIPEIFKAKKEIMMYKTDLLNAEIVKNKKEQIINAINLKTKGLIDDNKIIELVIYNYTNIKQIIDELNNTLDNKQNELDSIIDKNKQIIKEIDISKKESDLLQDKLNNILTKVNADKYINYKNKIIYAILNNDNYELISNDNLNKLESKINKYINGGLYNYELIIYKIVNYLNIRIILYNYKNNKLIKYYEPFGTQNTDLFNIYCVYNEENTQFDILYFISYEILIRQNYLFPNLENIYLKLNDNHKAQYYKPYNDYNLLCINKNLSNIPNPEINNIEHINLFINKIIKKLKIPFIFIQENKESLISFYYLLTYVLTNHYNDYTIKTQNSIKYYLILILLLKDDTKSYEHYTVFSILELIIFNINLENKEFIEYFTMFNKIKQYNETRTVINEFNNLLGYYYKTQDIDGNYRFMIESYFLSEPGKLELNNSTKFNSQEFKLYDKNGRGFINKFIISQLSTTLAFINLYNIKLWDNIFPLIDITYYYNKNIFIHYNSPGLTEELKLCIILMEYFQVSKIIEEANIDFVGEENGFINEYFNIIDSLYLVYKQTDFDSEDIYRKAAALYIQNHI
jgi:hypothetical protein